MNSITSLLAGGDTAYHTTGDPMVVFMAPFIAFRPESLHEGEVGVCEMPLAISSTDDVIVLDIREGLLVRCFENDKTIVSTQDQMKARVARVRLIQGANDSRDAAGARITSGKGADVRTSKTL